GGPGLARRRRAERLAGRAPRQLRLTRRDRFILFGPAAVLLMGWLVLPATLGLFATLTSYSPFSPTIRFTALDNYAAVLGDRQFAAAVRNILAFTAVAVPLELGLGFGLAYLLRRPLWGRGLWRVVLLAPWLVS